MKRHSGILLLAICIQLLTPAVDCPPLAAGQAKKSATLEGHSKRVRAVTFSPDGKVLASASDDGTIKLWDVITHKCTVTLQQNTVKLAFSPDGTTIAAGNRDGTINIWDVAKGKTTAVLEGHGGMVIGVAFSPDGNTLASASDDWEKKRGSFGDLKLWDLTTRKCTTTFEGNKAGGAFCVAFDPAGKMLASGWRDHAVRLTHLGSEKTAARLAGDAPIVSVVFNGSGDMLATLSDGTPNSEIKLWDAVTGKAVDAFLVTGGAMSLAFSPDGKTLATANSNHSIQFWDVSSGKNTATVGGHTGPVNTVAFAKDGKTLASGSDDKTIKLWSIDNTPK